jgi:hypothetical protein
VVLTNAIPTGFISWSVDDTIVYGQEGRGIVRVSANGGIAEAIVKAETERIISPQILPDNKAVLFTDATSQPYKVIVQSLKSGERKGLFAGDTAQYLPTGHIIFASGDNLFAILFDPNRLRDSRGSLEYRNIP